MRHILKSIFRNFIRKPVINWVNLLGLAVSLSLVIVLSAYCYSELTTDNFHKNGDRVYLYGKLNEGIYTPGILKEQISLNVPWVESAVRVGATWETPVFQVKNKEPLTSDLIFADSDFFKLFTYKAVQGSLVAALTDPMSVVITQSLSDKLFGREQAVGKTIRLNNDKELMVKAVIEEPQANSCLSFSAVTSIATERIVQPSDEFSWYENNFQTFLLLKKGANPDVTAKSILSLFPEDFKKFQTGAKLIPFKTLYFSKFSLFGSNYLHCGDKKKVIILVMVAVLVLLIALVNFINISSSQWLGRTIGIGVMKIIGAKRSTILRNILAEAFILFLLAFFIAVIIVMMINPLIEGYTGIHFNPKIIYSPAFMLFSIGGTFILSMLLSLIPALRISSSRAVDNLKKTVNTHTSGSFFRGVVVTAQFILSIVLI
jgi:putative ABC transport system permease protein